MVLFSRKHQEQDRAHLLQTSQLLINQLSSTEYLANHNEAFEQVQTIINSNNKSEVLNEIDQLFLKQLLNNPVIANLIQIHDCFDSFDQINSSSSGPKAICSNSYEAVQDLIKTIRLNCSSNEDNKELIKILNNIHFQSLIKAHDLIAADYDSFKSSSGQLNGGGGDCLKKMVGETIRVVNLRKIHGEPLGLTVEIDADTEQLMVARILAGSLADKQSALNVGDIILEVNGVQVFTPDELVYEISKSQDNITFKIGPGQVNNEKLTTSAFTRKLACYMRALYDYNPNEDTLLPCRELGLQFQRGDILQIVDKKDPIWWQAKQVDGDGKIGLIPSQELEERRKAFVAPEADYVYKISICGARISKKKRKTIYKSKDANEFDKAELILYEEVTRMPPFKRKTLVLIGPKGVGRRTLKNRLINSNPEKFGAVVPYTSRPQRVLEENGKNYWFADRATIEEEIRQHRFLEYGEHNEHLYGTHLDTIRDVIRDGKMCVLDCSPVSLKILHNSTEFMPYVIFIAAPGVEHLKNLYLGTSQRNLTFDRQSSIRFSSRRARTLESLASLYEDDDLLRTLEESACLQRQYGKYVDLFITNKDFDETFKTIVDSLDSLQTEHQWVPVNWIY